MKKFTVFILLFFLSIDSMLFAIKPRMTKTVVPHYSGVSGRRYYFPSYEEQNEEPVFINSGDFDTAYYSNPVTPITAEEVAIERNRRMRALQLQRSEKRPYGTRAYYSGSAADLPVGATPSTEGF